MARRRGKAKKETGNNKRSANHYDQEIGRRIRIIRQERGLSQSELGNQLGVSFQQIQKYEKGTNRVSGGRLMSLADVLRTSVAELTAAPDKDGASIVDAPTYNLAKRLVKAPSRRILHSLLNVIDAINESEKQQR